MFGLRWIPFAADAAGLASDAAAVVNLRLARLSRLDSAAMAEAQLMVFEKVEAVLVLQWRAMAGLLGTGPAEIAVASMDHVRRKVAANRRRLSRKP